MRKCLIVALCMLAALTASANFAADVHYQLKHTFTLGGDGGWDDLSYDASGNRLFLSRATRVMVVNPDNGTVLAEIPGTPGVHGIALADDLDKGFTSNGRENTVTVFDLKTLKQTAKIKVSGENPDAIVYEPVSRRVFTFNGRSNNSTVIDAVANKVVATIPLPGRPEFAIADGKGMVFVNIEDKSEISRIDARKAVVLNTWSLAPCVFPSGLSMDRTNRRLFSGCANKLMAIVDADSGKLITALPIGEGVDGTGFDPGTGLAFSSNGEGTLTVIHEDSKDRFSVLQDVRTRKFARTMALNPNNHDVYLVTAQVEVAPVAAAGERPKRSVVPGTFSLLVMSKQ